MEKLAKKIREIPSINLILNGLVLTIVIMTVVPLVMYIGNESECGNEYSLSETYKESN